MDFNFDNNFKRPLIGVDEVGRGSWAGPVMAGAAYLYSNKTLHEKLDDSKKLNLKMRNEILESLNDKGIFGIGESSNLEIDEIGILNATFLAMKRAIIDLLKRLDIKRLSVILIDGPNLPNYQNLYGAEIIAIKNGDGKSPSIAAASIFAKCYRDNFMSKMDKIYDGYGFGSNMGYGTKFHREKLKLKGSTQLHRMSFSPMKNLT